MDSLLAPNGYVYSIYYSGVNGDVGAISKTQQTGFGSTGGFTVSTVRNGLSVGGIYRRGSGVIPLGVADSSASVDTAISDGQNLKLYKPKGKHLPTQSVSAPGQH